ncbi:MAG: hypothetical protein AAFW00_12975 [Bacteroidota bacterium]
MEEIDPLYTRIDRYLKNEMSAEERAALEQEVQSDQGLADAMRAQVRAEYAARSYARDAKRERLKELLEETSTHEPSRIRSLRPYVTFAVAAAIVLLVLIGISIQSTKDVTSEALYAQNLDYTPTTLTSVRGDSLNLMWEAARKAYDAQNFQESINLLEQMVVDSSFASPSKAYLFLGVSYLKEREQQESNQQKESLELLTEKALSAFDLISTTSEFRDDIPWYKAMAYLQAGKTIEAIPFLQSIDEKNRGKHLHKARELLGILTR